MDYLRREAEELGLERLVTRALEFPGVQGVVVSLEPLWLTSYFLESGWLTGGTLKNWFEYCSQWGPPEHFLRTWLECGGAYPGLPSLGSIPLVATTHGKGIDVRARPSIWLNLMGDRNPIIVTVCLRPGFDIRELVLGEYEFAVRIETRPIARLAMGRKSKLRPLVGGLGIGTGMGKVGTLGGIVQNSYGKLLGLTCSHVASMGDSIFQPSSTDSTKATQIGNTTQATALTIAPGPSACNPYVSTLNRVDLSVIALGGGIAASRSILSIGNVTTVAPRTSLFPGLVVEVSGCECEHRSLVVGGLAVTYSFTDEADNLYCFEDLFELDWPSDPRLLLGRPVFQGDSGSWVVCQGPTGNEWCGVVVGEKRTRGFAFYADKAVEWMGVIGCTPRL